LRSSASASDAGSSGDSIAVAGGAGADRGIDDPGRDR
jgi:hypothetical protein